MTELENLLVDERPDDASEQGRTRVGSSSQAPMTKGNALGSHELQTVEFQSTTILKTLAYSIMVVIALHIMAMVSWFGFGHDNLKGVVPMLSLDNEKNLPTFFSTVQLMVAALLLGICALQDKLNQGKFLKHWIGLSAIFVYLAFDEAAAVHEKSLGITRELLGTTGIFYYAWIIPFGLLTLTVLLIYSRFLLSLPNKIGLIFFLSGALFVSGAIGVEMLESKINWAGEVRNLDYLALVTIEESLEIIGIYAFIYGLLKYLTAEGRPFRMTLVR